MLFAPIHWSAENASSARVGGLVAPFTDPFSGQPENKATPAAIEPVSFAQRGFILSRTTIAMPKEAWWARFAVAGGYGYWLAANMQIAEWKSFLPSRGETELAEYEDNAAGTYRAANFRNHRLESCLFVGPSESVLNLDAVKSVFASESLTDDERRLFLSGKSASGMATGGAVVCACFGVGQTTICDAIASGARSVTEIGAQLKAGTNCGSCIPELKRLIAQTPAAMNEAARGIAKIAG